MRLAHFYQRIHNAPQTFAVSDRWLCPTIQVARLFGCCITAEFPREKPASHWTPNLNADALVKGYWQQLIFCFTRFNGVMNLLADKFFCARAVSSHHGFHHMPAGKIGTPDVAHLALFHQSVHGLHGFFNWGLAVPFMQQINVDTVTLQALQAVLALLNDMSAR